MNSFPTSSGIYIAQKEEHIVMFEVKGVYPTLQLGKSIALDKFFCGGKLVEASKEIMANIELFPETWRFDKMKYINTGVFSKINFNANGIAFLSEEDEYAMRDKYYRLCMLGVSALKAAKAIAVEFKVSIDQMLCIVNRWDEESKYVN